MKRMTGLSLAIGLALSAGAQDTVQTGNLDEVLIYSNKFAERRKNVVQKIDIITAQRIAQLNAQNMGDLLATSGNLFVQKSQQGGSSPVIRGFEASRVLLVIDGIRMNNAIYRAGHLQNVITVDQNMLERVEILYGPASTLYGSDALGGVVHMITKRPATSLTGKTAAYGSAFARYSSVNNEKTGHFDINIGGRKWAWLQSYNFSDFGDMRMGNNYTDKYPNFGRRSQYIANISGIDTIVKNEDDRIQKFSGYRQWDITQKVAFQQNAKVSHLLNLQYSSSGNVPRYDRLQDVRNGALRWAQWYYGPQTRTLAAYELNVKDAGPFNELKAVVSHQYVRESRHQREYRRYDRLDNRIERLNVWAATIDGRKLWRQHELTVGVDAQLNFVRSQGIRRNVNTGAEAELDSRYPNGRNRMHYFGAYAQHLYKFGNGKWVLNDGIRLQTTRLSSTIANNSFFNFPFTSISQNTFAVTGNLGLVYLANNDLKINLGLSSGFRAPNIDDLARIFESNTASRQLIVPNPDVKPEYTYNFDLGVVQNIGNKFRFEATGFYTLFRNAIALSPFRLNGQDSVNYNGFTSRVFANQNVNKAYVTGFNTALTADVSKSIRLYGTVTYTYGRLQPRTGNEVPLDHIPPVYGKVSASYTKSKFNAEAFVLFNGWKRLRDYNPSGEDNAQYATPDGTPAWETWNFRVSYAPIKAFQIQAAIENIFDRNYRLFASGFSSGGRNLMIALRSNF
jgi:hemoglobin/transferrin/lactoferrin receptor protein